MKSGFIYIDKQAGMTSHDVIHKLRLLIAPQAKTSKERLRLAKVGHAGTLDPFATGLLLCAVGKEATSKLDQWLKKDKEYIATLELGKTSTTGDPEGEIVNVSENIPTQEQLHDAIQKFIGEIEQVPPKFSAIKVGGKRAYDLARSGEEFEMKKRNVVVYEIELVSYEYPHVVLRCKVGSGTYIRTLAEDIGKELGVGAYLTELRRTKIDSVKVEDAVTIDVLTSETIELYIHESTLT